jgi:hypothetical protein
VIRHARAIIDGNLPGARATAAEAARVSPTWVNLYQLGLYERATHHSRAAAEVFSRIRIADSPAELGPFSSWHLRIRAAVHHELGEYDTELELALLGQKSYPAEGSFFSQEAGALVALDRTRELDAAFARCEKAGTRSASLGPMLYHASRELAAHGHPGEAKAMAGRAAAWYKMRLDSVNPTPALRSSYANALTRAGDCPGGLAIRRELMKESPDSVSQQGSYAAALVFCSGSRDEARKIADALTKTDRPFLRGGHLFERARILAALGEGEPAMRALQASFAQGTGWSGTEMHLDFAWDPIRAYPPFVEWMKPKG